MRIGVIVNANSRRNRRKPGEVDLLRQVLGDHGRLEATSRLDELESALARLREDGTDVLALDGGDGTNHHTLTALLRRWPDWRPALALLRGGTMNTVSRSFGLRGRPVPLLRALVGHARAGTRPSADPRALLEVETGGTTRWGYIFGNGVVHDWLEVYYEDADPSPVVAAKIFARAVGSTLAGGALAKRLNQPVQVQVTRDGEAWCEGRMIAVLASTQEQIGLGIAPWQRCRERAGHFHAIAFEAPLMNVALALPRLVARRPLVGPGIHDTVTTCLRLESPSGHRFILDGDAYASPDAVEIRTGPVLDVLQLVP